MKMTDHDMSPHAGIPHLRFDEGEVASAMPRRVGLFRACGVCGVTLAAALASGVCRAENATIAELNLVQDATIDVASGSTTDVERVTGGAFTITKTGGGVVRFGFIQNTKAKLVIAGGHEEFYVPDASELLDEADLHFDANDMHNDGYVELLNGTNFITRWYQSSHPERALYAKHDDYAPACRSAPSSRRPFVRKSCQNGLDVIDFGSLQTTNNVDSSGRGLGYGAAMVLTSETNGMRDVFLIGGFTEDVKTFRADWPTCKNGMTSAGIIGSGGWNAFWPGLFSDAPAGDYPPLVNYWQNTVYAYQSVHGTIWVNDASYTGADNYANAKIILPDGLNFINFRLVDPPDGTERSSLYRFARWGNMSFGGARIGELAAFTRRLSDEERQKMENHLRSKWFAHRFADVKMISAGDIEKTTGGLTMCPGFSAAPNITITAGTLVVNPLANSGTWIHLDASQIDTADLATVNGKTVIDTWADADGGPHYASHDTWNGKWRANPQDRKPFMASGWASNGLNVVDFGYPQSPRVVDAEGNGVGYGAAMTFDVACATIREVLMVVGDYEEVKTMTTDYPGENQSAAMFLGGTRGSSAYFGRYSFQEGKMPIIINPWQNFAKPVTTNVNGIAVDGKLQNTSAEVRLEPGMHLIDFRSLANMNASAIAKDYANNNYGCFGGVRIGEMLVYESELEDTLRSRISATLMTKWLGVAPLMYEAARVTVDGGAVLEIPYAGISAAKLALGDGTIKAESVKARVIALTALTGTIDGELDLGDEGGTLTFDDSGMVSGGIPSVRALSAASVAGTARGWSAVGTSGRSYRITVGGDGLYCSVPDGFVILFK